MLPLARRKLFQFSLRGVLLLVTGCSVALGLWRMPFEADVKDDKEFQRWCSAGMTEKQVEEYREEQRAKRETGTVYRDFHGAWVKHGVSVLYDGAGRKLRERHWSHGKLDGVETTWDENNRYVEETNYRDGKRHGWSSFQARGDYLRRAYYENDQQLREESSTLYGKRVVEHRGDGTQVISTWSHTDAKLSECAVDRETPKQRVCVEHHQNGAICCRGAFQNRHEHGTWTWWDPQGAVVRKVDFMDGQRAPLRNLRWIKFVREESPPATVDTELSRCLCGRNDSGVEGDSLAEAIDGWADYFNDLFVGPGSARFAFKFRTTEVYDRLKQVRVPLELKRTKLRDALQLLRPLRLEAVAHGKSIWILDVDEARGWADAIPVQRFISYAGDIDLELGLIQGLTTLQGLIDNLKTYDVVLRLDESLAADSAALLGREVNADVFGCTIGAALDIVLSEIGLTFYAENDRFVIMPLDAP